MIHPKRAFRVLWFIPEELLSCLDCPNDNIAHCTCLLRKRASTTDITPQMAFNISAILANPACQVEYYPLASEVKTDGSNAFSILFVLFNYFFELLSSLPTSFVLAHIHVAVGFNFLFGKKKPSSCNIKVCEGPPCIGEPVFQLFHCHTSCVGKIHLCLLVRLRGCASIQSMRMSVLCSFHFSAPCL